MDYSDADVQLAIHLQARFDEEFKLQQNSNMKRKVSSKEPTHKKKDLTEIEQEKLSIPLSDPSWELIDPNPNIHSLFQIFNMQFFWGKLDAVVVEWSKAMTLCAGICRYEGRAGMCSVRLSAPLLKLRPRKDLIETLLHEMIHAYLFVTHNNRDRDGHGPNFHEHMYRINRIAGTHITVYHSFHNEVAVYQQHIWKCDGPCQHRHPYYGLLKRSRNRAPSKHDPWWAEHQSSCGGTYVKIKEPENYSSKKRKTTDDINMPSSKGDIRKFFKKDNIPAKTSSIGTVSNGGSTTVSSINVNSASNAKVHKINTTGNSSTPTTVPKKTYRSGGTATNSNSNTVVAVGVSKTRTDQVNDFVSGSLRNVGINKLPIVEKSTSGSERFVPFSGGGNALGSAPRSIIEIKKTKKPKRIVSSDISNLDNSVIIVNDDCIPIIIDDDSIPTTLKTSKTKNSSKDKFEKSMFPCPFCQNKFSAAEINIHALTHL